MKFFGKEEAELYSSMGDRTDGCFPISDDGIWHAGIHVYFSDSETPIKNPITGKVVSCCFKDEKSWNYVVIENEIKLPSKKKEEKTGYHCYNLISNLRSKMTFSELSIEDLRKIQSLPFFIKLKTNLPSTGSTFDKRNFKTFEVSLNFKHIIQNKNYQIAKEEYEYLECVEKDCHLSKGTTVKIKIDKKEIEIGKYNTNYPVEGITKVPSQQSYSYRSLGKFIDLKENLEETEGLFILRDNDIDKDGKITIESKEDLCFWRQKKGYIKKSEYPGFGIVAKKNTKEWENIISIIDEKYKKSNNKFKQFIESIPENESFIFAIPENNNYQIFPYIGESYDKNESYKITKADGKDVFVYYFPVDEYEYIKEKYTGWWKGKILDFYYSAAELWRDSNLTYTIMEKIETNKKYGNFFDTINLYDVNGKEFNAETNLFDKEKMQSDLYAKAKVCLSPEKEYDFIINSDDLFDNRIFIKDADVICSFTSTQMQFGYPSSEFVEIKTGEITFTNIEEVQEQIKANNNYIWLKNGNENIYVPKKYYENLKFQVIKSEVKKGDTIERGKVLGFPAWDKEPESNEIPASNPFIDYALFFTENITEKTTTLESINIQKDTECLIENISFTANDKKVFLSPSGCELSTKEISETEGYVELESVSYKIYVYPSGVERGYLTKDKECSLFLTTPKCKITVKNNKFDAVSSNSIEMVDSVKNCVEEFTNEIIIYMQNNQNTELGMSKDNPPQQLYKWVYKKDAQTIIEKNISANGNIQVIDTYKKNITFETAKIPKDFYETFVSTDLETITIEGKEYCKFLIENKAYYVSKNFVDQNKKNLLEEFNSKCISVNLKKNAISNNEVCPEGKLIITKENINKFKQNLIDKLSEENEDLIQYVTPVDDTEDYNIYNEKKNFYELLSKYLKRTISKHPIEWDFNKIKQDKVCETRGKAPIDENKCCDIAADLRTADSKLFGENRFYFLCPPYFYNKMDELGLLEFNPYEGKYADIYSDKIASNIDLNTYVKDSPGFAPKWIKGSWSINPENNGYAAVNGFFNQLYSHIGLKYHHEGIDFRGPDKTEVVSFINAKVIAYGWMTDSKGSIYGSGYGQTIFLYNLNGKGIYQLSHLSAYDKNIYVGKQYCPGNIVAYVGNSGHGLINDKEHWAPHLHLSYYDVSYDKNYEKFVYREGNVIKRNNKQFNDIWNKLRNPFDHDSTEKHGGFN